MRLAVCAAGLVLAFACGSPAPPAATTDATPQATAARTAPPGGALVRFDDDVVVAEIADDDEERRRGLMEREAMPDDEGMLFVFQASSSTGFWMKNTLIPLSIAYLRGSGEGTYEVVAILDMEPCRADPCPNYPPGAAYDAALEVNQGWFDQAGVDVGDEATVTVG